VADKGALDLQASVECKKHKKALTVQNSSANVTPFLLQREANQMMQY
jgi:hypothetical protein